MATHEAGTAEPFVNAPTVQELLRDASREVRSILWEVTALDGPGLAAAWPWFAAQAAGALGSVPLPAPATTQLVQRAQGSRSRPHRWGPPVDAEPDPHLVGAGRALAAVAELLRRYATPPPSVEAGREADQVRRRIAECLFVGAHATALGLAEHATRLRPARAGLAFARPAVRLVVGGANQAQSRRLASELATFEAHAAHYLAAPGVPEPPPGPVRRRLEHVVDPDRLAQAMAEWEVTAMRVVYSQPPCVRDLAGVARAEQAVLMYTMVILNATARASVIDPGDFDLLIRPRLQEAQAAWGEVATRWPAQMTTPAPHSLAGVQASAQLHEALGEITREGNTWATPALIARRVALAEVAGALRDAAMASVSRAERFAELPAELAEAGQLRAPARLLAAMQPGRNGPGHELDTAVRIADVANRRIVRVMPEQTAGARAAALALGRKLTSLTAALQTLPLGRPPRAPTEPAASARQPLWRAGPAGPAVASTQSVRRAAPGR
jgi:hypothetical protein